MKYRTCFLPFSTTHQVVEVVEVVEVGEVYPQWVHHKQLGKMYLLPEVKLKPWDNFHKSSQETEAKLTTSSMNCVATYN
jgi:hypothetical protein